MSNSKPKHIDLVVNHELSGKRLDLFLTSTLKDISRSQIQRLVADGNVLIDGNIGKSSQTVKENSRILVSLPPPQELEILPEKIPINILYEDRDIIVVNKSAGMVVHPAAGHYSGTLVNALLDHCKDLSGIGGEIKPGIVHRLDIGTSGVMVIAKNDHAHQEISKQFKSRGVKKIYLALVFGCMKNNSGLIEAAIGRSVRDRKKFSTRTRKARVAVTEWKVLKRFDKDMTLVEIRLHTGRTHQIRVHFAENHHPLVGDSVYGSDRRSRNLTSNRQKVASSFKRVALHASKLGFCHPKNGEWMEFEAPLPDDLKELLENI